MKRREFVTLLGGAAAAWPLEARAQQTGKLPTIGILGTATPSIQSQWFIGFVQRLRELGWIEDRTVAIELHWAEGRSERYTEIAADFVRRKVDVIVTSGAAVLAAKQATSVIPIVFAAANDRSAAANVTGLSLQAPDLAGKRLQLLRELVPGLRHLAILTNLDYPAAVLEMGEAKAAADTIGVEVAMLEIRGAEEIAPALESLKGRAATLYICTDPLLNTHRIRINTLANAARLPTIHGQREFVEAGGLISYGPSYPNLFRRAGDYVDKILRGAKPGDLPIEQPSKFDLTINLTTAKALGIEVPHQLLSRADEVIE